MECLWLPWKQGSVCLCMRVRVQFPLFGRGNPVVLLNQMNFETITCKLSGLSGEKLHLIFNKKSSLVYHVEVFLFIQCKLCYNSISYNLSGLLSLS